MNAQPVEPLESADVPEPTTHAGFESVADVIDQFTDQGYLADERLATTVFLQTHLDKPVLLEGPAGVGKTQLAKSLAAVTGRKLLRLQCYEGQDETTALYEWDYGRQLLYTQLMREKIGSLVADAPDLTSAVEAIATEESAFFSERFLAARPLLEAIRSEEPVVLLIDEVDRADEALEAVLLELLAEYQVSVPELGTFEAVHLPYVILTSNNSRDLSAALKRRCLHLFLDYPDAERELEIIRSKKTGLSDELARQLVDVVRGLRELDLRKAPSISETVDWARTLAVLGAEELSAETLAATANVVVKYDRDLKRTLEALPRLVDPNADPDLHQGHGHGHGHGHGDHSHGDHSHGDHSHGDHSHGDHSHGDHSHGDHSHQGGQDEPDGVAERRAKDQPGRHDEAYYGTGTMGPARSVSAGQGARAFASRRRPF